MAFGTGGFLAISKQSSFGTNTASWHYIPIVNETLTTKIEDLIEESIQNRFEEGASHQGVISVEGDIVMEAHPVLIGHFLRAALGPSSYTAVLSGYVHSNIFPPTQSDWDTNCTLPPHTIQVFRDVGSSYQFTDAVVNALTLEINAGAFTRMTASVIARTASLMNPTTTSYQTTTPWAWDAASISIGGSANADIETLSLKIENSVEGVSTLDATKRWSRIHRNGFRKFSLSGTMDFTSQDEYKAFRAGSMQQFAINIRGDTAVSSGYYNELKIDIPSLRYASYEAAIGGPSRIQASFEGNAKYNSGSGRALLITLQNSQEGY